MNINLRLRGKKKTVYSGRMFATEKGTEDDSSRNVTFPNYKFGRSRRQSKIPLENEGTNFANLSIKTQS